jgi:hypothetical protein
MSETNQIKQVSIIRNAPLSQDFQVLGYDREHIINKTARASFYDFSNSINPNLVPGKINTWDFTRSETRMYGINGNQFIWDNIPELENFPVSGLPNEVSQQYVLYSVNPTWPSKVASQMNIHQQSIPTAYNTTIDTSKQQQIVMQIPKSEVFNSVKKPNMFNAIKKFLVGK